MTTTTQPQTPMMRLEAARAAEAKALKTMDRARNRYDEAREAYEDAGQSVLDLENIVAAELNTIESLRPYRHTEAARRRTCEIIDATFGVRCSVTTLHAAWALEIDGLPDLDPKRRGGLADAIIAAGWIGWVVDTDDDLSCIVNSVGGRETLIDWMGSWD